MLLRLWGRGIVFELENVSERFPYSRELIDSSHGRNTGVIWHEFLARARRRLSDFCKHFVQILSSGDISSKLGNLVLVIRNICSLLDIGKRSLESRVLFSLFLELSVLHFNDRFKIFDFSTKRFNQIIMGILNWINSVRIWVFEFLSEFWNFLCFHSFKSD